MSIKKSALVVFYQVNETRELKRYLAKIKEKYGNGIQLISKKYQTYNDLLQQIKDLNLTVNTRGLVSFS